MESADGTEIILTELADGAIAMLASLVSISKKRVLFLEIPPPADVDLNHDFPVVGDLHARVQWTADLNELIARGIEEAATPGLGFVRYFGPATTSSGCLNTAVSDGNVHLDARWSKYKVEAVRLAGLGVQTPN